MRRGDDACSTHRADVLSLRRSHDVSTLGSKQMADTMELMQNGCPCRSIDGEMGAVKDKS